MEKLQSKQVDCKSLTDDDFDVLGDYYMGQMLGNSHEAMNNMMSQMMGDEGEKQMHIVMGKRLSGCDPTAATPSQGVGFIPMMGMLGMMGGSFNNFGRGGGGMMGNFGYGNMMGAAGLGLGLLWTVLWWALVILAIAAVVKWLFGKQQITDSGSKSLDILKERYAKGEIDKKEFEEKKKDLSN